MPRIIRRHLHLNLMDAWHFDTWFMKRGGSLWSFLTSNTFALFEDIFLLSRSIHIFVFRILYADYICACQRSAFLQSSLPSLCVFSGIFTPKTTKTKARNVRNFLSLKLIENVQGINENLKWRFKETWNISKVESLYRGTKKGTKRGTKIDLWSVEGVWRWFRMSQSSPSKQPKSVRWKDEENNESIEQVIYISLSHSFPKKNIFNKIITVLQYVKVTFNAFFQFFCNNLEFC